MFENVTTLIPHPGPAHRDEYISSAVILACNPNIEIQRRDPLPSDMDDENIIVLDQGGQHDPSLNNYDHHQLPRNHAPVCALTLILERMGLLGMARQAWPWLEFTEFLDSKGPFQLSRAVTVRIFATMGLDVPGNLDLPKVWKVLLGLMSPVEAQDLRQFEQCEELQRNGANAEVHAHLTRIGRGMLSYLSRFKSRWEELSKNLRIFNIDGLGIADVRFIAGNDDPVLALEAWLEHHNAGVACTITQDDRGPGLCLFRRSDHPRLDFSKCEGMEGVVFAHKGGFVCKLDEGMNPFPYIGHAIKD